MIRLAATAGISSPTIGEILGHHEPPRLAATAYISNLPIRMEAMCLGKYSNSSHNYIAVTNE